MKIYALKSDGLYWVAGCNAADLSSADGVSALAKDVGGVDILANMLKAEVERTGKTLESVATDFVTQHRPSSIIQRAATVDKVANMVVYVCSPQASATTEAALRVDGGVLDDIV